MGGLASGFFGGLIYGEIRGGTKILLTILAPTYSSHESWRERVLTKSCFSGSCIAFRSEDDNPLLHARSWERMLRQCMGQGKNVPAQAESSFLRLLGRLDTALIDTFQVR